MCISTFETVLNSYSMAGWYRCVIDPVRESFLVVRVIDSGSSPISCVRGLKFTLIINPSVLVTTSFLSHFRRLLVMFVSSS